MTEQDAKMQLLAKVAVQAVDPFEFMKAAQDYLDAMEEENQS